MRGVTTGAADKNTPRHHAIVAARQNRPVVSDETVGDAAQTPYRLFIADDQRFAAGVGAGHDQQQRLRLLQPRRAHRPFGRFVKQQIVQRRVGQHHAEVRQAGGDVGEGFYVRSHPRPLSRRARGAQQHDGSLRRFQQLPFVFAGFDPACQRRDVGRHDRERLGVALLALAEAGDGGGVLGVADQMKAAQSLDRQNLAREQACQRGGDHVIRFDRVAVGIAQG